MFGIGEQSGGLAKALAELIGEVAPGLSGGLTIRPDDDLPNCGRDNRPLTFRHMGQQRPHEWTMQVWIILDTTLPGARRRCPNSARQLP